jgi:myo-inositol-1(or 4)-monophosphatase
VTFLSILDTALEAVQSARQQACEALASGDLRQTEKSPNDWISSLDLLVDKEVRHFLKERLGNVRFISEEDAESWRPMSDACWILDPIDGTRNAILGIPYFAISLAYVDRGRVLVGVTCNVTTGETFHACRGQGFWRNGQRLPKIGDAMIRTPLANAVISTGFPHDKSLRPRQLRMVEWLVTQCSDIRRFACPTLDLCQLAYGRLHGVVEMLRPWDYAAGLLFLEEQGLRHNVRLPLAQEHFAPAFCLVAGTPAIFPALEAEAERLGLLAAVPDAA